MSGFNPRKQARGEDGKFGGRLGGVQAPTVAPAGPMWNVVSGENVPGGGSPSDVYARFGEVADLTSYERAIYKDAGVSSAVEAAKWKRMGANGRSCAAFRRAGVSTRVEAQKWLDAGIGGEECEQFSLALVKKSEDAQVWKGSGIDGWECLDYSKSGFHSFDQAHFLKTHRGVDGEEALQYHSAGVRGLGAIKEWKGWGVGGLDCMGCVAFKVKDPEVAARYRDRGLRGREMWEYHKAGLSDVQEALEWKDRGVSGVECYKYSQAGFTRLADVQELKSAGIGPDEAYDYFTSRMFLAGS